MAEHLYISERLRPLALPISSLTPDPANARLHPERNLETIKASLHKFGQRKCIVVQKKGMVVRAGNGTMEAAKSLGWTHLACNVIDEDSTDATAYAIADNRTAELAEWDEEVLASLLQSLPPEAQVSAGFDESELNELLSSLTPEIAQDVVPEPPASPVSRSGDLWLCGGHRVLCGDSTSADDVGRLMAGDRSDCWVTDPPYNVALGMETPEQAKARNRRTDSKVVANDKMSDADFRCFLKSLFACAFDSMKPGASFYVWHSDSEIHNFSSAIVDCGEKTRQCLIWKKNALVMGRRDYQSIHEPCLYGWKDGASHGWYSDRKQTTVIEVDRPTSSGEHPTMKPVALFSYIIGNSTSPQGLVFDGCLGSGTTLIAAEQLGRKCYGMEISPQYVDVIVTRWQKLTGKQATLEATGATFEQTAQDREVDIGPPVNV